MTAPRIGLAYNPTNDAALELRERAAGLAAHARGRVLDGARRATSTTLVAGAADDRRR